MRPFKYLRVTDAGAAVNAVATEVHARFLAGGTNLLDLMKEDIERPGTLVDVSGLDLHDVREAEDGVTIGALMRNADTANHPVIRKEYPLLTQAIVAGASAQIRNMATNGGNLLQRTRCPYFYDIAMPCNKREPGAGCGAREGLNRNHAVIGWSDKCVATYPGDMANALYALEATVKVRGAAGKERTIPIHEFHRLPGDSPEKDNTLAPGELIVSLHLPKSKMAAHSFYLKVRDRASYAFALVAVAVGLEIEGDVIRKARLVLGGVAHKPWRSRDAEEALAGQPATVESCRKAADLAFQEARPLTHNAFKVDLGKRAVINAVLRAAGKI